MSEIQELTSAYYKERTAQRDEIDKVAVQRANLAGPRGSEPWHASYKDAYDMVNKRLAENHARNMEGVVVLSADERNEKWIASGRSFDSDEDFKDFMTWSYMTSEEFRPIFPPSEDGKEDIRKWFMEKEIADSEAAIRRIEAAKIKDEKDRVTRKYILIGGALIIIGVLVYFVILR